MLAASLKLVEMSEQLLVIATLIKRVFLVIETLVTKVYLVISTAVTGVKRSLSAKLSTVVKGKRMMLALRRRRLCQVAWRRRGKGCNGMSWTGPPTRPLISTLLIEMSQLPGG